MEAAIIEMVKEIGYGVILRPKYTTLGLLCHTIIQLLLVSSLLRLTGFVALVKIALSTTWLQEELQKEQGRRQSIIKLNPAVVVQRWPRRGSSTNQRPALFLARIH